jgi:acyl-[acyl-carrier-protein]-phospholipid O-acyltransferase/long-chain-fatty-acid--[acyl-carrier-protein] ligase
VKRIAAVGLALLSPVTSFAVPTGRVAPLRAPNAAAFAVRPPLLNSPLPSPSLSPSPLLPSLPSLSPLPALQAPSLAPSARAAVPSAAPAAPSALIAPFAQPAPAQDAPAESHAADASARFDLSVAKPGSGLAVPADAPAPGGAPASSGLQPSGAPPSSDLRRSIPTVPNERPWLLRVYPLVKALLKPFLTLVYPVSVNGASHIPATGGVLLVANHVGYIDPLLVAYAAGRPVRFLMDRGIYEGWKPLTWFFKGIGAIPVGQGESRDAVNRSLAQAKAALDAGEVVVIFPEGKLTNTGGMDRFRRGFENLARETGVPVIPAHVDGVWGSLFSRREDFRSKTRRVLAEFGRDKAVRFGPALKTADTASARQAVQELGAAAMEARVRRSGQTLGRDFFASAKRRWKKPAVSDSTGAKLSYGETLTGAVLVGGALESRLGASRNVGVWLPGSVGGALANLGLTLKGRVPVNLNVTASKEALAHAARVAGLDTVVTSRRFVQALGERASIPAGPNVVYLEDLQAAIPAWKKAVVFALLRLLPTTLGEAVFARRAAVSLDDTAAILFTSGSSSLPKGVELTHLNLRANSEMIREAYSFRPDDIILGTLPLFHSFGFAMTLWTPLLKGIAVAYHANPLELKAVAKLARESKATVLLGTPGFLERYLRGVKAEDFASVRLAVAGAEKLRPEMAEAFRAKFGVKPLEGYGATELSPVAAVNVPDRLGQRGNLEGTVGQPLPGQAARVVDPATHEPLPPGREGLLLIKGPNVMKGYLGEPKKTAEALRDGWYVTGDIAVMSGEGFIKLVGRASRFSKIAGEMVGHEAVEEKLHAAGGGQGQLFAVTAVPDEKRGERLVVLYAGWDGDLEQLLARVRQSLPNLWVPDKASFHKVEALPLLGTGKLDLKALQAKALELEAAQ